MGQEAAREEDERARQERTAEAERVRHLHDELRVVRLVATEHVADANVGRGRNAKVDHVDERDRVGHNLSKYQPT